MPSLLICARWRFLWVGAPRRVAARTFEREPAARACTNCRTSFSCQRAFARGSDAQEVATVFGTCFDRQNPKLYNCIAVRQTKQRGEPRLLIRARWRVGIRTPRRITYLFAMATREGVAVSMHRNASDNISDPKWFPKLLPKVVPKTVTQSGALDAKMVPKAATKSGSQNCDTKRRTRQMLFESNLCSPRVPKHVPKMGTVFGAQNKNSLHANA